MQHKWKDRHGSEHPARIVFKDGREIHCEDRDIDLIVRQSTPIVPAQIGFELLSFGYEPGSSDPGPWIHREPIIGWRDSPHGGLDPVVTDYDFTQVEDQHAILSPSGRIQCVDRWFESEEKWAADMKFAADETHANKQAAVSKSAADSSD